MDMGAALEPVSPFVEEAGALEPSDDSVEDHFRASASDDGFDPVLERIRHRGHDLVDGPLEEGA